MIDFYNAAPLPNMPVAMHLDVRPALDSAQAAWDRFAVHWGGVLGDLSARLFPTEPKPKRQPKPSTP